MIDKVVCRSWVSDYCLLCPIAESDAVGGNLVSIKGLSPTGVGFHLVSGYGEGWGRVAVPREKKTAHKTRWFCEPFDCSRVAERQGSRLATCR